MTETIIAVAGVVVSALHVHGFLKWRGRLYLKARGLGLEAEIDTRE